MFLQKSSLFLLLIFTEQVFAFAYPKDSTTVFAELLYWQVSEAGADNWAQVISPPAANQSIQFLNLFF